MKLIAISSGKGGVGKTTISCHLAFALSTLNQKVLILDADLGLANVDIHFGISPLKTLADVFKSEPLKNCITSIAKNIDLIAGGSGILELLQINAFQRREVMNQIQDLHFSYDYVIIDTSSGLHDHVLHLTAAADEALIVITEDPSSFTDAYALIKSLSYKYKVQDFKVICNLIDSTKAAQLFLKFSEVTEKFLSLHLQFLGSLPSEGQLFKSQQLKRLILKQSVEPSLKISKVSHDESLFCTAIKQMALSLIAEHAEDEIIKSSVLTNQKSSSTNKGFEALFRPVSGHA